MIDEYKFENVVVHLVPQLVMVMSSKQQYLMRVAA